MPGADEIHCVARTAVRTGVQATGEESRHHYLQSTNAAAGGLCTDESGDPLAGPVPHLRVWRVPGKRPQREARGTYAHRQHT